MEIQNEFTSAKGCMQGTVWIEPHKCESVLHMEGQGQYVKGVLHVCWGRPSVYGGTACKDGLG